MLFLKIIGFYIAISIFTICHAKDTYTSVENEMYVSNKGKILTLDELKTKIDLKEIENKRIGILSSLQNQLGIFNLSDYNIYQAKSISSWNINDYIQTSIFNKIKDKFTQAKIINTSLNTIILPESYSQKDEILKKIMKNQDVEVLLFIENTYASELRIYYHMYDPFDDKYYNRARLHLRVRLLKIDSDEKLQEISSVVYAQNEFDLKDNGKKLESNEDKEYVRKTLLQKLEPILKKAVLKRTLKALEIIQVVDN